MGIEIASYHPQLHPLYPFHLDYFFLEGKNGVEASALDLTKLSARIMEEFGNRDHPIRSAFVNYDGEPFYLKLRGAGVTRPPYFDQMFGATKFDFKLPEDQQGQNILALDTILENVDEFPNMKFGGMDAAFEPRKFLYGGNSHYMGVKVTPGRTRVWKTIETVTTELDTESVRAGDDVDLLLSATLWTRRGNGEDYLPPRAGWSWKVEQIKILPRRVEGGGRGVMEQLAL